MVNEVKFFQERTKRLILTIDIIFMYIKVFLKITQTTIRFAQRYMYFIFVFNNESQFNFPYNMPNK